MTDEIQEAIEEPDSTVEAVDGEADAGELAQDPPKAWDDEVEQDARALGWKSPNEWKGDIPAGYIDNPNDFLDRLEKSKPFRIMRERAEAAERKTQEEQRKTQEELRRITAALEAGHKREMERRKADYETQLRAIAASQRRAVEEGDTERFDQLERHRASLKPPEPEQFQQPQPQPQADPAAEFAQERPWLNDPVIRQAGAAAIDQAFQAGLLPPNASVKDQIEYAETRVKQYFPHMFAAPEPTPAPKAKVDGGGLGGSKARTGFDTLPREAREEFKRQVAKGTFEDTEDDRRFYFNEYQNG